WSGASVTGGLRAGGLVGLTHSANIISGSFATGRVTAIGGRAGGLVGQNGGAISDSYATGAVSGNIAGGLIGLDTADGQIDITNVFAAGPVSGATSAGGLNGRVESNTLPHVANAYWDITATGQSSAGISGNATALTTGELQDGTLPNGFSSTVWRTQVGSYPTLLGPRQSVTGNVFTGPGGLPLAGATVRLLVNGVNIGLTSTTTAGGFYSFDLPGGTIPNTGGDLIAVLTVGGSRHVFYAA